MSTDESHRQECSERDWEAVARNVLAPQIRDAQREISEQMHDLADQIEDGEIDPRTRSRTRTQLDMAILLVEENLGPTRGSAILTEFESDKINRGDFIRREQTDE